MSLQQETTTSKPKSTGRRFIDGLFGNRNARQQQERLEELEAQLQEYELLAEEREGKLAFVNSIRQEAATAMTRLLETLHALSIHREPSEVPALCSTAKDEAEQLFTLIRQLPASDDVDDRDVVNAVKGETPTASDTKQPVAVLATDDEAAGQRLEAVLATGYDVRRCRNGWQALAEVYRNGADIIIAKAHMEVMNGTTMCRRLRSNPQTSLIPVILLVDDDRQRLQALQHGADVCVATSVGEEMLVASVNNLLQGRRQLLLDYDQQRRMARHDTGAQKKMSTNEKLIERVMSTIHKNLKDSSLSVDMIADEVGVSRVHLHRKMKEIVGQTPHDFIRQLRLEQAARLLANGDMNITEVAYACGFSNAASFSTTFKSIYGLAPSEYMAEKRKGEMV